MTELQILGEISFDKSLYEGLNAENHRTKVIPVCFLGSVLGKLLSLRAPVQALCCCPVPVFSLITSDLHSATNCLGDLELVSFCLSFSVCEMRQLNEA